MFIEIDINHDENGVAPILYRKHITNTVDTIEIVCKVLSLFLVKIKKIIAIELILWVKK